MYVGATLVFDVELLNVGDQAPTTNVFKEIDQDQDKQLSRDEVSEYLKKQMAAAEGAEGGDDIKQMMSDHEKLVEEIFQHEDKDKNGFISHDEFTGPKHDELWWGTQKMYVYGVRGRGMEMVVGRGGFVELRRARYHVWYIIMY